jgi:hypothetical protein
VTIALGTFSRGNETLSRVLEFGNLYYLVIYTVEFAMKFSTFGFSYFDNNYNRFDSFLVFVSYIEFAQTILDLEIFASASVLRVFRGTKSRVGAS